MINTSSIETFSVSFIIISFIVYFSKQAILNIFFLNDVTQSRLAFFGAIILCRCIQIKQRTNVRKAAALATKKETNNEGEALKTFEFKEMAFSNKADSLKLARLASVALVSLLGRTVNVQLFLIIITYMHTFIPILRRLIM